MSQSLFWTQPKFSRAIIQQIYPFYGDGFSQFWKIQNAGFIYFIAYMIYFVKDYLTIIADIIYSYAKQGAVMETIKGLNALYSILWFSNKICFLTSWLIILIHLKKCCNILWNLDRGMESAYDVCGAHQKSFEVGWILFGILNAKKQ